MSSDLASKLDAELSESTEQNKSKHVHTGSCCHSTTSKSDGGAEQPFDSSQFQKDIHSVMASITVPKPKNEKLARIKARLQRKNEARHK